MNTELTRDTLDQTIFAWAPKYKLIHHSNRGSHYLSIKYSEHLAEAGIEPSGGSVVDSYDNAMAETIGGLYKAEEIWSKGPFRSVDEVEYETLKWVNWYNNLKLLESIGNIPPKRV